MVSASSGLTNNGVRDYIIQRVSGAVIAAYVIFLLGYLVCHPALDFGTWQTLFSNQLMRVFTLLTVFCILLHGYIGLWGVFTDYIKPIFIRLICQAIAFVGLFACFCWAIFILWSV